MNRFANVIFGYEPKNDDELELKVGDEIEIIGLEEEGWWRGKLRGKVGVFPTNFVQVIDSNAATQTISSNNNNNNITTSNNNNNNINSTTNKLSSGLFSNKANKNSLSSNSLNSNNSNNNNNMNSAQQADSGAQQQATNEDSTNTYSERRPKPIRGVGFGDIFALNGGIPNISSSLAKPPKPLPSDPITQSASMGAAATERLSSTNYTNTLQKQVPKKPPPPAPVSDSDQAPALPPKPVNQFSPLLQQQQQHHQQLHHQLARPPPPPSQQHQANNTKWAGASNTQRPREQAEVIYAYEPVNDDELAMEVGDIIDVIDKDIEDAGWWRGELRGKIGVFPDNFVQLIDRKMEQTPNMPTSGHQANPNLSNNNTHDNSGKINNKPVFAATPKDFSKELESNLQHNIHNNMVATMNAVASLLSVRRNKLQQMATMDPTYENDRNAPPLEHSASLTSPTSIGKLNNITANRAKGPSRRPPSNILNKRNQSLDQSTLTSSSSSSSSSSKRKTAFQNEKDEPVTSNVAAPKLLSKLASDDLSSENGKHASHQATSHDLLSSPMATATPQQQSLTTTNNPYLQNATRSIAQVPATENATAKPSLQATQDSLLENQTNAPKTSQRLNQASSLLNSTSSQSNTPSWMVELKKAHAEKKRDSPAVVGPTSTPSIATTPTTIITNNNSSLASTNNHTSQQEEELPPQLTPPNNKAPISKAAQQEASHQANVANGQSTSVAETTINSNSNSNQSNGLPINERKSSVQSALRHNTGYQPKNPVTAGVKSLTSRYSADYNLASDLEKRANFLSSSSTNNINNIKSDSLDIKSEPETSVSTSVPSAKKEIEKTLTTTSDKAANVAQANSTQINGTQYDKLINQISTNFDSQLSELRLEIKSLKDGLLGFSELKKDVEVMREELKTCQKATENQRRYIKDLVNNLADERKKLASMQEEIDRTLK